MNIKRLGKHPQKRIYLIAPKTPGSFWSMQATVDAVGARALMPNAALATLIALTPRDAGVEYIYCDENLEPARFDQPCDLVALTGYTLHAPRLRSIAEEFRSRGVPVALGGAYATLDPEGARPLADHLFIGEAEYTWPAFLRDWQSGNAKGCYEQSTPIDIDDSPPPDWSMIRARDYLYFTVQTSRGCPNRCAFCDAIRIVGRKHRAKTIDQVMDEIERARSAGATTIFFSEDNFFVRKERVRELLERIVAWNRSLPRPVSFSCQASVAIADDDAIVQLLADARMSVVFLGVESVREACLKEIDKGHLYRANLAERVRALSEHGILPFIGLIVGFDHDDAQTFAELHDFVRDTASPLASISVLNAPRQTVLHERMLKAGRIAESFGGTWHSSTNIIPTAMPLDELIGGHRSLFQGLYAPEEFEERALAWLKGVRYFSPVYQAKKQNLQKILGAFPVFKYYLFHAPPEVRSLFWRLLKASWQIDPRLVRKAITIMTQYCHYYQFVNSEGWNQAAA